MPVFRHQRIYQGRVEMVVFDLSGTIVDYGHCAPSGTLIELFKRHGITVTKSQAKDAIRYNKRDSISSLLQLPNVAKAWKEEVGHDCTEDEIDDLYKEFIPLEMELLPNFCAPIPNAAEILKEINFFQNRHIAATTESNREMTDILLKSCEENGINFETSKCSDDVSQNRPAPWMIYRAMEDLHIFPTDMVVNVGDTIADIQAGLNAGVWSVGVAMTGNMLGIDLDTFESEMTIGDIANPLHDIHEEMYKEGAHFVIDSLEEIESVIIEIERRIALGIKP